jgi:ferredoxin-NADP reductase/fatty acid desaturase
MNSEVSSTGFSSLALKAQDKDWTDYSSGVAWGTVALSIGVSLAYIGLIVGIASDLISLPIGMLIATVIIYLGFTVAHEAGHGNISHEVTWMKPYERMLGWSMNLLFLVLPFGLFAKMHDYHHAFTNDPERDPDHWVSGDTWIEASWRAATLPFNYLYLAVTRFKNDPIITQTHKSSVAYYAITLPIIAGLITVGLGWELLIIGVIPIFIVSFVLGMLFDWIPHKPSRQQSRYQNTRSYLFPGLKYLTLGQNYHHIHHLYPRVSWYHYQRVFNRTRPELEAKNAPIEHLFSKYLPRFGKSPYALEPSSIDGQHKLTLRVDNIERETDSAVAISFAPYNGKTIPFKAGQYVTLSKLINGEPVTRCYSICESAMSGKSGKLSIGVKRVENGLLSTYLNNELVVGEELTVAGPFGNFVFEPSKTKSVKVLTLIAGGSGITPILSIAKTALETCPETVVNLIYANRSIVDTMFLQQLNQVSLDYAQRLKITNIYEKTHVGWEGYTGYLNEEKLCDILKNHTKEALFYICGPGAMKKVVVSTLSSLDVDSNRIFIEEFSQSAPKAEGPVHKVNIVLTNGISHHLDVAENQTILQVATQEGIRIPHACGVGQCGCCMMQVTEGKSELASEETPGILPTEQARGLTLACQCRPKSALSLKE